MVIILTKKQKFVKYAKVKFLQSCKMWQVREKNGENQRGLNHWVHEITDSWLTKRKSLRHKMLERMQTTCIFTYNMPRNIKYFVARSCFTCAHNFATKDKVTCKVFFNLICPGTFNTFRFNQNVWSLIVAAAQAGRMRALGGGVQQNICKAERWEFNSARKCSVTLMGVPVCGKKTQKIYVRAIKVCYGNSHMRGSIQRGMWCFIQEAQTAHKMCV